MSIFHEKFSASDTCAATGVSNSTLQTWLKRGVITAHPPEGSPATKPITGGGSSGSHRRFSFFSVMELAIAKELIDTGLRDLEHAFRAARAFAHVGGIGVSGDGNRLPGCPFDGAGKSATTLIAVRDERSAEIFYQVGSDPLPLIWHGLGGRRQRGFVMIDAELVFERTVTALGYDPVQVLSAAYGRSSAG